MTDKTLSLLKIPKESPTQNNIYYQHLTLECLGKCPVSGKAAIPIDRTRGIPCSGNTIITGNYQSKAMQMSYGAKYRRKHQCLLPITKTLNAFRQYSETGCTKSIKPLSNFN